VILEGQMGHNESCESECHCEVVEFALRQQFEQDQHWNIDVLIVYWQLGKFFVSSSTKQRRIFRYLRLRELFEEVRSVDYSEDFQREQWLWRRK
jgi:hypothetical protein